MSYTKNRKGDTMGKSKTVATLLSGALVGAGLGILFAPKSGEKTRKELKSKIDELVAQAKETDFDDVKEYVVQKSEEIENALADLDKEKVLKIAKKKAEEIQNSALDLVDYVKEKGEPVLESSAKAVRQKAILVTKSVLKKLESE